MNWFIFFGIIFIVGIIFFACRDLVDYGWDDFFSFMGGLLCSVSLPIFIFLLFSTAGINAEFEQFKARYNFDKELIEEYVAGNDYGNIPSLTEEVLEVNKTIAKHKAFWNNGWHDVWNCEEIGNLEPLSLPKKIQNI